MFSHRVFQNLLIGCVILLWLLGLGWAFSSGTKAGKTAVILKNTAALDQGLRYFYNDQNRYPTPQEVEDRAVMLEYFTMFPPPQITGGPCAQTYRYASVAPRSFTLEFCLPASTRGFAEGWNKVTQ